MMSKEYYHFTIDVEMDQSNVDQMVKAEWDAEDFGEEWPCWVAAHAFAGCWKDNYAVNMTVQQVSMTGDRRNLGSEMGLIPEELIEG